MRVVRVGLGGVQVGFGLRQLLVQFRVSRSRPAARPFSLARRCRSTSASGSPRCARRWANRYRRSRCRAAQSCRPARPASAAAQSPWARPAPGSCLASTLLWWMRLRMPNSASAANDQQHNHERRQRPSAAQSASARARAACRGPRALSRRSGSGSDSSFIMLLRKLQLA